jgi:patched 1 protein
MVASLFAVSKLSYGFELTDLLPKNTNDYRFLNVQNKLFGFYNMYAVTKGDFEYPTNQKLVYEYHEAFIKVSSVIKNDNGGLPDFWLSLFRDWLLNLQDSFDRDYRDGKITREHWYSNATDDSILAYKLLVQTGHVDNPVDKSLITHGRLVDKEGIINPKGFYNYLSAWAWNDALGYSASQVFIYLLIRKKSPFCKQIGKSKQCARVLFRFGLVFFEKGWELLSLVLTIHSSFFSREI